MSFTPYIWPGMLAFFVPLSFMVYMFRFRDVPGARPFSLLMGITSLWTLFHLPLCANLLLDRSEPETRCKPKGGRRTD
jgi:hypothetical protein